MIKIWDRSMLGHSLTGRAAGANYRQHQGSLHAWNSDDMKKSEFEMKNADAVRPGDQIWVYGSWMRIEDVQHVVRHPVQLYEFHVAAFKECLRVPGGWQVRVKKL